MDTFSVQDIIVVYNYSTQGTIGLELLEQIPDLDAVLVSISGGGLSAGIATAIKSIKPECKIYLVTPQGTYMGVFKGPYHSSFRVLNFLLPEVGCRIVEEFLCHTLNFAYLSSKQTDLSSIQENLPQTQHDLHTKQATNLQHKYAPGYVYPGICWAKKNKTLDLCQHCCPTFRGNKH